MKRIGVVGIVLKGDRAVAVEMQKVLSDFADIIVGRMGVPREEANAIALIVEGSQERVSALTGRLGKFPELSVKSGVGLRFVRDLEQGKSTLRLDKVNQLLDFFNYEMAPQPKQNKQR